ncbi:MAG: hypothetical protein OEY14_06100, partial [Myxococcales bacterium]|nr:hypothetical protein [Myxococcales bacterium]
PSASSASSSLREPTVRLSSAASEIWRASGSDRHDEGELSGVEPRAERDPLGRALSSVRPALEGSALDASSEGGAIGPPVTDRGLGRPAAASSEPQEAGEDALLSDVLRAALEAADRRLFPGEAPMPLRLPIGDEGPEELVPEDLLAPEPPPLSSFEEDPFERIPLATEPPEGPSSLLEEGLSEDDSRIIEAAPGGAPIGAPAETQPQIRPRRPRRTRSEGSETLDFFDFGAPMPEGRGRQGLLERGEVIALLSSLWERRLNVRLRLFPEGAEPFSLWIADGRPSRMEGPIASRASRALSASGVGFGFEPEIGVEADALAALERGCEEGSISRLELERALRQAREALLHAAVGAERARFELEPISRAPERDDPDRASIFQRTLPGELLEAARRGLEAEDAPRLLGPGPWILQLLDDSYRRFRDAELEPELLRLLERFEGEPLERLLREAPASEGLMGAIFALQRMGALALRRGPAPSLEPAAIDPEAARARLLRAWEIAEQGDYLQILGIPSGSTGRQVRLAFEARCAEIAALGAEIAALGGEEGTLRGHRQEILDALHEAYELLRVRRLRRAYERALRL